MKNIQDIYYFIKIDKKKGNNLIKSLRTFNLLSPRFKIIQKDNFLYIPIKDPNDESVGDNFTALKKIFDYTIIPNYHREISNLLIERNKSETNLQDTLKRLLPKEVHGIIPRSFDIIGQIAIIELNREELLPLKPYIRIIGDTLLDLFPNLQSVYEKAGDVEGIERIRKFKCISGIDNTITKYKENGCNFKVDIAKTFFTPRLSNERNILSNLKTPYNNYGIIWDVFCGVGPFIIQIAKKNPLSLCIGTDINKNAIELARENKLISKLKENLQFIHVDISKIWSNEKFLFLKKKVSRLIMNLPKRNIEFLDYITPTIHPKGALLHIYQFNEKENPEKDAINRLTHKLNSIGLILEKIESFRVVKPYSPAFVMTCTDCIISSSP